MLIRIIDLIRMMLDNVREWITKDKRASYENEEAILEVDKARMEWIAATDYFNSVSDPGLIDHAIYEMVSAERKYMYLLKKLRERFGAEMPVERLMAAGEKKDRRLCC